MAYKPTPSEIRRQEANAALAAEAFGEADPEEPAVEPTGETPPEVERPSRSANKPEWVAYAVAQGRDEEEAESMTKDELIAEFGGEE